MSYANNPADHKLVLPDVQQCKFGNFTPGNNEENRDIDGKHCSHQKEYLFDTFHLERSETFSDSENEPASFIILNNPSLIPKTDDPLEKHETNGVKIKQSYPVQRERKNVPSVNACPPIESCSYDQKREENVESNRKNIVSNSFNFGQILHRKQSNSSLRNKSADSFEVASTQNGASLPKNPSSTSHSNTQTQVKTKLRSLWNNMKYGWRVKREVNLKLDSVTYLLGVCYHNKSDDDFIAEDASREFKLDLQSKIWLTYRINFPMIPGTDLISDSGWGCMLRCGQMMMAQALVCHFLTREWRINLDPPNDEKHSTYKKILSWFGDTLSEKSPFSLHNLVSLGVNYGRKAGDWYGPTHAAQVLRDALLYKAKMHSPEMKHLSMYVALDGIVFKQDVFDLCSKPSNSSESGMTIPTTKRPFQGSEPNLLYPQPSTDSNSFVYSKSVGQSTNKNAPEHCECSDFLKNDNLVDACPSYADFGPPSFSTVDSYWSSLIMFVSVRLGNDKINPFYIPCLKSLLAYENCIGIIGGRPKHALYFIGWQEDKLIHMDPHSCQPVVDVEKGDFNEKSFHSGSIRTMSFAEMDPSCAIGFYFRKREEFQHFIDKFSEITAPMKKNLDYPIFALAEGKRTDVEEVDSHHRYSRSSILRSSKIDEDDYILL